MCSMIDQHSKEWGPSQVNIMNHWSWTTVNCWCELAYYNYIINYYKTIFLKRKSYFVPSLITRRGLTQYGGLDIGPSLLQVVYQERLLKWLEIFTSVLNPVFPWMVTHQIILCHIQWGVKQGENLSLLLFSLYINDLENFLVHKNVNPVTVTDEITGTYLKIFFTFVCRWHYNYC